MKTVQSVRTSCDSGCAAKNSLPSCSSDVVKSFTQQFKMFTSSIFIMCKVKYPRASFASILMRTVRHRRSLLKSLKAVSKNIHRQAQQEKVHKQQRRPQTLNGCKEQSIQEIWRASVEQTEQQHTVVFRTDATNTSFPTSPILNQTLHQKCLV